MSWLRYLWAVMIMTVVGFASLMAILMTAAVAAVQSAEDRECSWHLAFNTAWSFTCNADWQSYTGESTMSYFSQMIGLSVHQFMSGAAGLAVLVAVGRALKRHTMKTIGNFWVDLTRGASLHRDSAVGALGDSAGLAGLSADLEAVPGRETGRAVHHASAEDR